MMNVTEIKDRARLIPGVEKLNAMQEATLASPSSRLILIAPTGSGKTLAFGMRILRRLGKHDNKLQALVIAPSRELVMQIAQVIRIIAGGYKIVELYGGHPMPDEIASLSPMPEIIVATPGRFLDHLQRSTLELEKSPEILVLDEYDKALQLGFEREMKKIISRIGSPSETVMTSATRMAELPPYLNLKNPEVIESEPVKGPGGRLETVMVESFSRDKLDTLVALLRSLPADDKSIVFVNHRESAERVFQRLKKEHIAAVLYHGALDQQQRTVAVDLFANGTAPVMVATDLAARGLDVEAVNSVIHYHQPIDEETWIHRNGRTARQQASGTVYVITSEADNIAEYIKSDRPLQPAAKSDRKWPANASLYFAAGKKEKISKGDIAGFLMANTDLKPDDIGKILVHDHFSVAAVPSALVRELASALNAFKLKGKKVRITQIKL